MMRFCIVGLDRRSTCHFQIGARPFDRRSSVSNGDFVEAPEPVIAAEIK
jgi:hypothetical protein